MVATMILVAGATGRAWFGDLPPVARAESPGAGLVRPGSPKEAALRDIGVEISAGDLRSRDAVDAACRGVSAVISTVTAIGA